MSYPLNPPASYYLPRRMLQEPLVWLGSGLWVSRVADSNHFFWEPPWRNSAEPGDWLVGPYSSMRSAERDLKSFVDNESEGPELRAWAP